MAAVPAVYGSPRCASHQGVARTEAAWTCHSGSLRLMSQRCHRASASGRPVWKAEGGRISSNADCSTQAMDRPHCGRGHHSCHGPSFRTRPLEDTSLGSRLQKPQHCLPEVPCVQDVAKSQRPWPSPIAAAQHPWTQDTGLFPGAGIENEAALNHVFLVDVSHCIHFVGCMFITATRSCHYHQVVMEPQ